MRFEAFFAAATGYPPHEYQARVARDGLPGLLRAPTGAGKSAVILAWLWRRLYGPEPDRTPRRLVYALPRRSLTEPLSGSVRHWLTGLGLLDEVALHVALGSWDDGWGDWREAGPARSPRWIAAASSRPGSAAAAPFGGRR